MRSRIFFVVIILLAIIIFAGFWFNKNMETIKICFGKNCFITEVVRTQADRARGLMFKESLDQDKAMLFVFPDKAVHSFWMKNCLIPLDIIWLDDDYKVLAIKPNNPPCPKKGDCSSINPNVSAKYVLEINAGLSSKIGLQEGNYLSISATTLPTIDK